MFKWFKNKCFLFHDWGRYEILNSYEFKRTCMKCGEERIGKY